MYNINLIKYMKIDWIHPQIRYYMKLIKIMKIKKIKKMKKMIHKMDKINQYKNNINFQKMMF